MIRWFFMGVCAIGAVSSCIDHDALCVILNTFGVYLWSLDPVRP